MLRAFALAMATVACGPRAADPSQAREGISIGIYLGGRERGIVIVDDRRWLDVVEGTVVLDRIDATAELASLVVEPLGSQRFVVGACTREALVVDPAPGRTARRDRGATVPSPIVRCTVDAPPGRHFARVVHVAPGLALQPAHEIHVRERDRKARVATRFTVATPIWRAAADVAIHDRVPGGDVPARELLRGPMTLDGSIATLAIPPREVGAVLRAVYDGALVEPGEDPAEESWGESSRAHVLAVLDLSATLTPGPAHVHVAMADGQIREVPVAADVREDRLAGVTRLPLWVDPDLVGRRERSTLGFDERAAAQDVSLRVSNHGVAARTVLVEERLRPARRRELRSPTAPIPTIVGDVARVELVVAPGATERVAFVIDYRF